MGLLAVAFPSSRLERNLTQPLTHATRIALGRNPPARHTPRELYVAHTDNTMNLPMPLGNSVDASTYAVHFTRNAPFFLPSAGDSTFSTLSYLKTAPPLREPSAQSARRIKSQAAAEVIATVAAETSVATAVHDPGAAAARSDAVGSALHSTVASAVPSVAIAVNEPAAAVRSSDDFAPAPHLFLALLGA